LGGKRLGWGGHKVGFWEGYPSPSRGGVRAEPRKLEIFAIFRVNFELVDYLSKNLYIFFKLN
jgi:hypothetical protein